MLDTLRSPHQRRAVRALLLLLAAAPVAALAQSVPAISSIVATSGSQLASAPVRGKDGALYGTASVVNIVTGGLIYRATTDGRSMRTLYQLKPTDGANPVGGLLLASDELLYGTTSSGAFTDANSSGTVYRLAQDGSDFKVLRRLQGYTLNSQGQPVNQEGVSPEAELVEGSDGALYGVTRIGGPNSTGVVFRISKDGTQFSVLHVFGAISSAANVVPATNADGISPQGPLMAAADGYLYGTTSSGGATGSGTLFRVRLDGTGFEVVYVFTATTTTSTGSAINADGAAPVAGLTDGNDSRLYGVTSIGGTAGHGTVFAFDPVGKVFSTLHSFDGTRGARPIGELLRAANGSLYGTTANGGSNAAGNVTTFGTIFSIGRDGTGFTSLKSFEGTNGSSPTGRLLQLDASTFVGVAAGGAECGQGAIYQFSLTGATVQGLTNCGRRDSGGGSLGPLLVLLLGVPGVLRRLRSA